MEYVQSAAINRLIGELSSLFMEYVQSPHINVLIAAVFRQYDTQRIVLGEGYALDHLVLTTSPKY